MSLSTTVIGSYCKPECVDTPSWFDEKPGQKPKECPSRDYDKFAAEVDHQVTSALRRLQTTVIGSYPKSAYCEIPNWFTNQGDFNPLELEEYKKKLSSREYEQSINRGLQEILDEQCEIGIDVVTDGEIRRDNYINHLCRRIKGIDFVNLTKKSCRNGAWVAYVPTIRAKPEVDGDISWIAKEWQDAQNKTEKPVKATVPGPMTIIGSTANTAYDDVRELNKELVKVVNAHIKCLADAGCRHIQLDEPVMMREPDVALEYGIDDAAQCFDGVVPEVTKAVHLCCGYPLYLDQKDYQKADKDAYIKLADKLDCAGFDQISIEDTHRRNDLALFDRFKKTTIVLGSVAIADSRVETVEEIRARLIDVLRHLPSPNRLVVAPDCGLGFLPRDILRAKLTNMTRAAKSIPV
ncbi:5-methyltetrahydropteroyltriglutamate--homocysteine methyltransferase-like [Diadema setosum]|uniref:5-methyltetrahydropteroyltriglutamate-- homocysteine methyltransferase-like n=1 Tax=Diadema setosum TaxID=31175 RepID=UPI003B3B0EEA